MKPILLLCCTICTSFVVFSQDYCPLKSKDIYHYTTFNKTEGFTLKIDSVKAEGSDSVYHLSKQLRKANKPNCNYTATGDSWLGDSVRIKTDGSAIFVNKYKQPFLIKTKARITEKWIAYTNSEWKAEMTMVNILTGTTILGSDSIKTYFLNIVNLNGAEIPHKYDGLIITLSKTLGFIQTFNIYNFGTDENDFLEVGVKFLYLAGKDGFTGGLRNITGKDIFNFEPGDVFHREQSFSNFGDFTRVKILDTILEKSQDQFGYTYKISSRRETNKNNIFSSSVQVFEETYSFNQFLAIPKTASTQDLSIFVYSPDFKKWGKETGFDLRKGESDCIQEIIDGGFCHRTYYEGLGGMYYDCSNMIGFGRSVSALVYYKKKNEEWGKPLILNFESEHLNYQVSVLPNPAKDYLQVQVPEGLNNFVLYLKDLSGTNIIRKEISGKGTIDISNLKPGLYFYNLSDSEKVIKTGKVVVE